MQHVNHQSCLARRPPILLLATSCLAALGSALQESPPHAKPEVSVRFEVHTPELGSGEQVFITGNLPELGNWNPGKVPMQPAGDHVWVFELNCREDYPIEYKFTLGSWQREGAGADGRPLKNLNTQANANLVVKDRIEFWTTGKPPSLTGGVTGTVRYHRHLEFEGLSPRDLIVWLPADYETSGQPYPVLYMHDGQNLIDPRTSSFGEDWQVDETCTRLIAEKRMRPLIVVGIYNTADRTKEYVSGETGDRYVRFVIETVKPLIDATYRTKSDRVATAVGGSSAGGLCAFRMAWEHPQVFSKAICMSPAFQYQRPDGSFSVDYRAAFDESKTPEPMPFFYLDNGGVGLEKLLQPGIDQMLAALQSRKLVEEQNFVWKLYPDSRHDESGWAERLPTALQRLFPVESGSELSGEE